MMDYTTFQRRLHTYSTKYLPRKITSRKRAPSNLVELSQESLESFLEGATWFYQNYQPYLHDKRIIQTIHSDYYSHQDMSSVHEQSTQYEMFSAGITWAVETLSSIKGLYRFSVYLGQSGLLEGAFIATAQDVDDIIGQIVFFEKMWSTQDEIKFVIQSHHISLVTDDEHVVNTLESQNFSVGVNPLNHII